VSKFRAFFGGCETFTIPGRTYPVDVVYAREPEEDYILASLKCVMQLHVSAPPGRHSPLRRHARFSQADGDHTTLMAVFDAWVRVERSKSWCDENFLHFRALKFAEEVRGQLRLIMTRQRLPIGSSGTHSSLLRQALVSGFFMNAARKCAEGYKALQDGQLVHLHPSSAIFQRAPLWVVFHSLRSTTKEYMRTVSPVEMEWLVRFAPNFYATQTADEMSREKATERIAPLHNPFLGPGEWRWSRQSRRRR
jgi:ATP-dependent RNA helicase DHX8/PRP22